MTVYWLTDWLTDWLTHIIGHSSKCVIECVYSPLYNLCAAFCNIWLQWERAPPLKLSHFDWATSDIMTQTRLHKYYRTTANYIVNWHAITHGKELKCHQVFKTTVLHPQCTKYDRKLVISAARETKHYVVCWDVKIRNYATFTTGNSTKS